MSHDPTWMPLNNEVDLDHCLDTKILIYLLLPALAELCAPQVPLFNLLHRLSGKFQKIQSWQ